ncbi:MAG: M28 family peptidase [Bacteroidota bacterium]
MPFTVYQDSVAETGIRINGKDYQWDKDFGLYTDFNHACDMRLSEAVFAGYGISTDKYNDYKDLDVVGKLVVVYGGEPMHDSIYVLSGRKSFTAWSYPPPKVQAATRLGAAALLVIEKKFPLELYNYKASTLWRTPFKFYQGVNTFFISEEMARNIFKEKFDTITAWHKMDTLPKYKYQVTEVTLHYKRSLHTKEGANIIGVIEGSDKKDEYVILTAHYDHLGMRGDKIFYGANDNASGTTAMLKIAEAFAKAKAAGQGPRRTIVFMWTSGEENGLWGSDVYVNDPVYPLDKTSANVNMDMLGRISNEYAGDKDSLNNVYIIGPGILSSDLKPLLEKTTKNSTLKTRL